MPSTESENARCGRTVRNEVLIHSDGTITFGTTVNVQEYTPSSRIEITRASKIFWTASGVQTTAFSGISLKAEAGSFVALLGPSGCGKTTLLNLVAGLLAPTEGSVTVGGKDVSELAPGAIGYMFQRDTLLPWATAEANVRLPLRVRRAASDSREHGGTDGADVGKDGGRERARNLLAAVGLNGFEDHYPYQLSGGMRKRVQLARLLAQDARVLLMDEPFGALDAHTKLLMQQEFLDLWEREREGTTPRETVLWVTHDAREAIALADRIVVMFTEDDRPPAILDVKIDRPRDLAAANATPQFHELFAEVWSLMKGE